jgi:transposase-like protein
VEAWRGSGQTITAFAQHYGVHPERLGRWHRLLRTEVQGGVRFHPVRVRRLGEAQRSEAEKIELVLGGDRCIRLPHGFDAEDLRRLLVVVGAGEGC